MECAQIRFYVEQFREDFEALDEFRRHQPRPLRAMLGHRRGYERVVQTVRALRPIYEQTAGLTDLSRDVSGRAYVMIRSRFFRGLNRRFNAADFWPEHVSGDLRERWFGIDPVRGVTETITSVQRVLADLMPQLLGSVPRAVAREEAGETLERDISSSQTQILAVFLGLPGLEALATDRDKRFKVWLAEQLWTLHEGPTGGLLASGYTGASDERLIAFIKELWMRRNYGGKFGQTVRSLARDPVTFGPGWNSNVFATGGVRQAKSYWSRFLGELPSWSAEVTRFLEACQYIGKNANPVRGVVFTDPLDGAEVQWNPVRRATKKLPAGDHYIEARLPGVVLTDRKSGQKRFIRRPWRVDTRAEGELANRIAPCVIHALDAYFNALVLMYLNQKADLANVVAIHDSWMIPAYVGGVPGCDGLGSALLDKAITRASEDWLADEGPRLGVGAVYDWFVTALAGSPYEDFAIGVRDRWGRRVTEQRWPRFTAS